MSKKVTSITEHKQRKKPVPTREVVRSMAQRLKKLSDEAPPEPKGFASGGDMSKILQEEDDREDER
jgi:hypothetical protein